MDPAAAMQPAGQYDHLAFLRGTCNERAAANAWPCNNTEREDNHGNSNQVTKTPYTAAAVPGIGSIITPSDLDLLCKQNNLLTRDLCSSSQCSVHSRRKEDNH